MSSKRCATLLALALIPSFSHASLQPGHLDPGFGTDGKRIVGASLPGGSQRGPAKLVEGPEGRLYLVGSVERPDATVAIAVARLSRDGAVDTSFHDGGLLEFVPGGVSNAVAYGATFDAQQRLVLVGETALGGRHSLVCRLDADGSVDPTFGTEDTPGCIVETLGEQDWANDVVVQACPVPDECLDGTRIVVAGTRVDAEGVRRGIVSAFQADGSALDAAFGTSGVVYVTEDMAANANELTSLSRNASGALAAGGWIESLPGNFDMQVLRIRPGGEPEDAFGQGGYSVLSFNLLGETLGHDIVDSAWLDDDEVVWLAGRAQFETNSYRPALVKLNSIGEGVVEFDGATVAQTGQLYYELCTAPCDARFADMAVLDDGSIVLAGSIAQGDADDTDLSEKNDSFAMRVLPNGAPDPTFTSVGGTQPGLSIVDHGEVLGNSDDVATSLLLQDNKIVVAGYARAADPNPDDDINDYYDFALARVGGGNPIFSDGFE